MRVLIADKFEKSGLDGLAAVGCTVIFKPDVNDDSLTDAIKKANPDVLVVRGTKVTESMLDTGSIKLIVRAGAGYNTIDVKGASRRGIYVSNCPGQNSIAVAELAFGLVLALDRRIADNVADLRAGKWNKGEYSKSKGLYGQTLALIGLGKIGQEMAKRAKAFGMRVVAWSRSLTPELAAEIGVEWQPDMISAVQKGDVVSIHVALTPATHNMIGKDVFEAMKPGAQFINTSRGEIVDQDALIAAMRSKGIRAGLDVFANEPTGANGEYTDEIIREPNFYGTHHIGASTDQAQEAIAAETIRIVKTFMETGKVPNVVNLATSTPAIYTLVVRHKDRPGVLAHVFDILKAADINVQETENIVFDGAEAAVARINVDTHLPDYVVHDIRSGNKDIIDVTLFELATPAGSDDV
ncbi:MAG: 3-phosphoglycerate dehydrogenase family protein [Chthonomonadales bacterium]